MDTVLVTGSNGFIGRNLVNRIKNNYHVIGVGKNSLSKSDCHEYVSWNISDERTPDALFNSEVDYIIHAAASLTDDGLSNNLILTNCVGTYNILRFAKQKRVKGIIYLSSLPVVGNDHPVPIKEDALVKPPSLYHATKVAGEYILEQAINEGINVISLRVPSPIGPGMPEKTIVPIFVKKALNHEDIVLSGKGTRKQNYIDVRDLCEAIYRLLPNDFAVGTFNIGAKSIISNKDLASLCIKALDSKSRVLYSGSDDPYDGIDWTTDDSKLRSFIGDYQKYSLENTILDIASSYQ